MRCERTGAPPAGNRGPCHIYLGTHRGSEPSSPSEPSSGGGAFGANSKIARPLILGALLDAKRVERRESGAPGEFAEIENMTAEQLADFIRKQAEESLH
jgi:hypothetical protein